MLKYYSLKFITKLFKNWRIPIFNLQVGSCNYERTPVTWSQKTPIKTNTYTGLQIIWVLLRYFTLQPTSYCHFIIFAGIPQGHRLLVTKTDQQAGTWLICSTCMLFPLKVISTNIKCFNSNSSLHSKHHLWFHKINHHLV